MKSRSPILFAGVAGAVLLAAGGGFGLARLLDKPKAVAEAKEEPEAHDDQIAMSEEAVRASEIRTETVASGDLASELRVQAVVAPLPGGEAVLGAQAGGVVTRVFKRLGDPVGAGETLAVVESAQAAGIAADRSVSAAKAALARKVLARERTLHDQGVSSRQDFEQAQAEADAAEAEVRRAGAAASVARLTGDGRGVRVTSPIAGRVTAASVRLGAFVQPEAELFRVADPAKVQVEASVVGAEAARVVPGARAVLDLPDGGSVTATVRSVTPTLDQHSRAATVVLDPSGDAGLLRPGQVLGARITGSAAAGARGVTLPEEAVQTLEARPVVFVRTKTGFKARPVRLGARGAGRVEVLEGLAPGEAVATRNAFLLKAEAGKGEGEGH